MKNKLLISLLLFFVISACAGMGGKRSDKSDEFLIEKKNPLVMPPDINELPKPKDGKDGGIDENNFKETLKSSNEKTQNSTNEVSGTLQESIIKKIEQ